MKKLNEESKILRYKISVNHMKNLTYDKKHNIDRKIYRRPN